MSSSFRKVTTTVCHKFKEFRRRIAACLAEMETNLQQIKNVRYLRVSLDLDGIETGLGGKHGLGIVCKVLRLLVLNCFGKKTAVGDETEISNESTRSLGFRTYFEFVSTWTGWHH